MGRKIFRVGVYGQVSDLSVVRKFADLTCNRGFFSILLAEQTAVALERICVEANRALIP